MPMVFSERMLFVHVPRTGGKSVTQFLLNVLPRPVWFQTNNPDWPEGPGVTRLKGPQHLSLAGAARVVARHGFTLEDFPLILAAIRNPYAIEVSYYELMRAAADADEFLSESRRHPRLARKLSFPEWARVVLGERKRGGRLGPRFPDLARRLTYEGRLPDNLVLVDHDDLEGGVRAALRSIGLAADADFPRLDRRVCRDWRSYYNPEAERIVHARHRWLFDAGLYDRLRLAETDDLGGGVPALSGTPEP